MLISILILISVSKELMLIFKQKNICHFNMLSINFTVKVRTNLPSRCIYHSPIAYLNNRLCKLMFIAINVILFCTVLPCLKGDRLSLYVLLNLRCAQLMLLFCLVRTTTFVLCWLLLSVLPLWPCRILNSICTYSHTLCLVPTRINKNHSLYIVYIVLPCRPKLLLIAPHFAFKITPHIQIFISYDILFSPIYMTDG